MIEVKKSGMFPTILCKYCVFELRFEIRSPKLSLKTDANEKTLLQKQCGMGKQTEGSKIVLGPKTQILLLRSILLDTKTSKQSGNNQSQCFFSVSQMISCLRPYVTNVDDTKSAA